MKKTGCWKLLVLLLALGSLSLGRANCVEGGDSECLDLIRSECEEFVTTKCDGNTHYDPLDAKHYPDENVPEKLPFTKSQNECLFYYYAREYNELVDEARMCAIYIPTVAYQERKRAEEAAANAPDLTPLFIAATVLVAAGFFTFLAVAARKRSHAKGTPNAASSTELASAGQSESVGEMA